MEPIDATIIDADDRETAVAGFRGDDVLLIDRDALQSATGWLLKPEGLCRADVCVPTRSRPELVVKHDDDELIDLSVFGALLLRPTVVDAAEAIAAFGTSAASRAEQQASLEAPDFVVNDLDGVPISLEDFHGKKKMLVAFASWCGCRYDLPAWQEMHAELAPHGFSIIGVAVDEQPDDVREWVEGVDFPIALDRDHVITERYDIRNVPTVIWIDEDNNIARPNDVAFGTDMFKEFNGIDSSPHHDALRRWVTDDEAPLSEAEITKHLGQLSDDEQLARVHWRVAIALHRQDREAAAARHFDRAGELAPVDLTIRRSSMPLRGVDPFLSEEFFELYENYLAADRPGYGFSHPKPDL